MLHLNESEFEHDWENNTWKPSIKGSNIDNFINSYLTPLETIEIWRLKITSNIIYASGVMTNMLLLLYLLYYKRYRVPVYCVMLSLGVSDLGVCASALFWTAMVRTTVIGPPVLCNVALFFLHCTFLSSSYHLVVFAILRFFQLVYPLQSRAKVTTSLIRRICIVIWLASFIHAFINTFFFRTLEAKYKGKVVYVCWFVGNIRILSIWCSIVWLLLPFLITVIFHIGKHGVILIRKYRLVSVKSSEQCQLKGRQTDSRALAVVISMYLLTNCPLAIHDLLLSLFGLVLPPSQWLLPHVVYQLAFWNSALNPWIYFFAAESVRSDFRSLFISKRKKR